MKIINTYIEYINNKKQLKNDDYSNIDYIKTSSEKLRIIRYSQ